MSPGLHYLDIVSCGYDDDLEEVACMRSGVLGPTVYDVYAVLVHGAVAKPALLIGFYSRGYEFKEVNIAYGVPAED